MLKSARDGHPNAFRINHGGCFAAFFLILRKFFTRSGYAKTGLGQQVEVVFLVSNLYRRPEVGSRAAHREVRRRKRRRISRSSVSCEISRCDISARQRYHDTSERLATDTPLLLAKPTHIALVLLCLDRMCLAPRLACMHRTVTRTRWPMRKRTDHRWQRSPQLRPGDY